MGLFHGQSGPVPLQHVQPLLDDGGDEAFNVQPFVARGAANEQPASRITRLGARLGDQTAQFVKELGRIVHVIPVPVIALLRRLLAFPRTEGRALLFPLTLACLHPIIKAPKDTPKLLTACKLQKQFALWSKRVAQRVNFLCHELGEDLRFCKLCDLGLGQRLAFFLGVCDSDGSLPNHAHPVCRLEQVVRPTLRLPLQSLFGHQSLFACQSLVQQSSTTRQRQSDGSFAIAVQRSFELRALQHTCTLRSTGFRGEPSLPRNVL
mmetsp:Transcript_9928/g.31700  ORF Transcript_9928/g.31700 Transcript_9928/m.31700 type:complete len:264 (-) Transcript_9928:200-991(-)